MPRMNPDTRLMTTCVRVWVIVPRADSLPPTSDTAKMAAA